MAERYAEGTLYIRRAAILKLCAFAGRDVTLGEVDPDLMRRFGDWCREKLLSRTAAQYMSNVLSVYRHADPEGYAKHAGGWPGAKTSESSKCEAPENPETNGARRTPELSPGDAPEGSLMHFLHRVYLPYKMDMEKSSGEWLHFHIAPLDPGSVATSC